MPSVFVRFFEERKNKRNGNKLTNIDYFLGTSWRAIEQRMFYFVLDTEPLLF